MANFKEIIQYFETYSDNHTQVNGYDWGNLAEINTNDIQFPAVFVNPIPSDNETNVTTFKFDVYFLDVLLQDRSNLLDVMNNTTQIGNDFIAFFTDNSQSTGFELDDETVTITPFVGKFDEFLGGWFYSIEIETVSSLGCNLPINITPPTPPSGETIVYGSGTINYLSKWETAHKLTDSILSESGDTISVNGNLYVLNDLIDSTGTSGTTNQLLSVGVNGVTWIDAPQTGILGAGTTNYIPKFTGDTAIGNSNIYDDGTNVGIGTTTPNQKLNVRGTLRVDASVGTVFDIVAGKSGGNIDLKADAYAGAYPPITFWTGGAEKVRINNSGNVGIGTTTSTSLLEIRGEGYTDMLKVTDDSSGNSVVIGASNSRGFVLVDGSSLYLGTGGSEKLVIFGDNIGIGTTTPTVLLDVNGEAIIRGDLTVLGTTTTVDTDELLVKDNIIEVNHGETGAGVTAGTAGIRVDRGTEDDYLFVFDESDDTFKIGITGDTQTVATRDNLTDNNVPRFNGTGYTFVDSSITALDNGNVGIGTTSPAAKLSFEPRPYTTSGSHLDGIIFQHPTGDYKAVIQSLRVDAGLIGMDYIMGANSYLNTGGVPNRFDNAKASSLLRFSRSGTVEFFTGTSSENPIVRMAVNGIGNVGIGTITPTALLHIKAGTATAGTAPLKLTAGTLLTTPEAGTIEYVTGKFVLQSDALQVSSLIGGSAVDSKITYKSTTGVGTATGIAHQFVGGTDGATTVMTILNNGKVGVGTVSPSGKLDIVGGSGYVSIPTGGHYINASYGFIAGNYTALREGLVDSGINATGLILNTGGAYPIIFKTNNTERIRINSVGNVGIGTSTPNSTLEVSGSFSTNYTIVTGSTYSVLSTDYAIEVQVTGSTITLPTAVGIKGRIYEIDNSSTGDITVDTTSSETINGELTQTLFSDSNMKVQSNGTNWRIK